MKILVCLFVLFFSACSFKVEKGAGLKNYMLENPQISISSKKLKDDLLLELPLSPMHLRNKNIFYHEGLRVGFYTRHQWEMPPAYFLLHALNYAFLQSSLFNDVKTQKSLSSPRYILHSKILKYEFFSDKKQVILELNLNLSDTKNKLEKHKIINVKKDVKSMEFQDVLQAFSKANDELILGIIEWIKSEVSE